jgi:hypothetical protein
MKRASTIIAFLFLSGCGDPAGTNRDSGVAPRDLTGIDVAAIACGTDVCTGGKICVVDTPGLPPSPDAGNGYQYRCADLPATCAGTTPTCNPADPNQAGNQPGCLEPLCAPNGSINCRFDGVTLFCFGI